MDMGRFMELADGELLSGVIGAYPATPDGWGRRDSRYFDERCPAHTAGLTRLGAALPFTGVLVLTEIRSSL